MIKKILLTFLVFSISVFSNSNNFKNEKRETRAVWLTTNFQLDWPPKTFDPEVQKKSLIKILDKIKSLKLNTVYFQVRANGTVLFNSSYEPYPFYLTGSFDEQPSYDPLQFAIDEAHKRGLQIHAWVNVMRCYANEASIDLENPKHLFQKKNNWIVKKEEGEKTQGWLNPGIFNARAYLIDLFAEIVENYNVDGIHLDFMRYPGKDFEDEDLYNSEDSDLDIHQWRRENINKFLKVLYIRTKLIREDIKIGATPIGIYKNQTDASGMQGFYDVYQESEKWIDENFIDYLAPQIYWDIENNPKFEILAEDWKKRSKNRKVILGIATYKPEVKAQLNEIINISRKSNSDGVAFFRYQNIADIEKPLFEHSALPAKMNWLKGEMPDVNVNLSYSYLDKTNNLVKFSWNASDKATGYYLLFKSMPGEFSMDDVVLTIPADKTSVILNLKKPKQFLYKFALKAMDNLYNLSDEQSNEVTVYPGLLNELFEIKTNFSKPRLIKNSSGETKILLNVKQAELIEIFERYDSGDELIISEFLNSGKNVIKLPNGREYKKIVIKFSTSKKEVSLRI